MDYSELLDKILKTLEINHFNLYHSVSKKEICSYAEQLKERINDLDVVQFDYEMLKLFAKFKDAHTTYWVKTEYLERNINCIKNKLYITEGESLCEIKEINGVNSQEIINKFTEVIAYETEEWKNYLLKTIKNAYYFKMFNILKDDKLDCLLINGQTITIKNVYRNRQFEKQKNYSYSIKNGVLYLKYSKCKDEEDKKFADLVQEIQTKVEQWNISRYILDLRDNAGGNSEILNPFQQLVKEKNMQGVLLINNGVFSSGRFAVARFKDKFNTPLIGEATGGAAKSYGYCMPLKVDNKEFSVSIRLWDFSNVFGYEGAIQPDIYVEDNYEDKLKGKDKALEKAFEELAAFREKPNLSL